jgi:hypothetical protein
MVKKPLARYRAKRHFSKTAEAGHEVVIGGWNKANSGP